MITTAKMCRDMQCIRLNSYTPKLLNSYIQNS